ncbi:hypothetical protein N7495_009273 [Penicillium taxi]|uniref:uncharacterized protein n=1 Tax=Penicillium taxi TaxID=168475 RepID=UPI00254583E3|nr:uncharacterized protein N7495_009273 [Penicillium taxi]KAJ5884763.1 hypothetical protein N7495_009273 [Penicillium taxi]
MAVPQRTLNWLYSILTTDHHDPKQTYHDPNRAYHDVVNALAKYPSLSPRTDVYTYENGSSALLLQVVGTLPVVFRGSTYRFPVTLWIPNTYSREAPMVYVTPPQDMVVRVGQHVTLEGRVYHHYLAHWAETWDKSNIADFLSILRDVFAKEPPVRYRQPPQLRAQIPPPLPPLPPGMGHSPAQNNVQSPVLISQAPPQLPPKLEAGSSQPRPQPQPQPPTQIAERYQSPPPRPPLPPHLSNEHRQASPSSYMHEDNRGSWPSQQYAHAQAPLPHPMPQGVQPPAMYNRSNTGPVGPINSPQHTPHGLGSGPVSVQHQRTSSQYLGYQPQPGPPYQQSPYPQNYQDSAAAAAPKPKTETPDLLTSPFELELPSFTPSGPAPPIPPNPEKDALLRAVSKALAENLQTQASQSEIAAQSLISQSHSLHAAMATLQGEIAILNNLNATLQSNTATLQHSIQRADATIADAQTRSASGSASASAPSSTVTSSADISSGLPPIDEVLVAPTVVGKQLYDLVAEEQGLQHALYALQSALVRGVIGVDSWSRHTRGLARESFLKRALIRKIGRGMGLEESGQA